MVRTGVLLRSVSGRVVGVVAAFVAVLVVLIPGAWAQVNVQGKWSTLLEQNASAPALCGPKEAESVTRDAAQYEQAYALYRGNCQTCEP